MNEDISPIVVSKVNNVNINAKMSKYGDFSESDKNIVNGDRRLTGTEGDRGSGSLRGDIGSDEKNSGGGTEGSRGIDSKKSSRKKLKPSQLVIEDSPFESEP